MSDKLTKLQAAVQAATDKLAAAQAALDTYNADQAAEAARLNIVEGTEVGFSFGRGETKQDLKGKVIATVETPNGRLLKVLAGEGASIKVYDVRAKDAAIPSEVVGGDQSLHAAIDAAAELGVALEPDLSNHPVEQVTGTELTHENVGDQDAAALAVAQL